MDIVTRLRAAGCVFAEDEAGLITGTAAGPAQVEAMVARRVAGAPLEHVLGWAAFGGLRLAVGPGVFVPRRRSEALAREAVALAAPGGVVAELCCGAAPIAAFIATAVPSAEVHAAELDPAALPYARRNLPTGHVHQGDLYAALPAGLRGRITVLACNAPYVPSGQIGLLPAEARLYEPLPALDGGADGVDVQRRVAAGASQWLAPGGHLLIETSSRQVAATSAAFAAAGLTTRVVEDDELEATVVVGRR